MAHVVCQQSHESLLNLLRVFWAKTGLFSDLKMKYEKDNMADRIYKKNFRSTLELKENVSNDLMSDALQGLH